MGKAKTCNSWSRMRINLQLQHSYLYNSLASLSTLGLLGTTKIMGNLILDVSFRNYSLSISCKHIFVNLEPVIRYSGPFVIYTKFILVQINVQRIRTAAKLRDIVAPSTIKVKTMP